MYDLVTNTIQGSYVFLGILSSQKSGDIKYQETLYYGLMEIIRIKECITMDSAISKKVTIISYVIAFTFIIAMVTASVILKNHLIILPELAAMAIAMWVYREAGWIRQPSKILIAPFFTAVIGFLVNQLDIAYVLKIGFTLVLLMLFLRLIQSNLAPSIATGLLPVVINATDWIFIISTFILTFILMLGVLTFRLNEGLEKKVKIQYKYMLVFLALNFVWAGLSWIVGYPQLAAIPPILVVVYESLQKPMYNGKVAFKQGLVLTISATLGTLLYFAIDSWILVTLVNMIVMYILLRITGIRIPAVYAFPLLPFVFPDEFVVMLPLGSLIACVFLFGSVLAYKKVEMKRREKENANAQEVKGN
jgi:predicted outer membrane lipoprotein